MIKEIISKHFNLEDNIKLLPKFNIVLNRREIIVKEDKCIGCGKCREVCPTNAITYNNKLHIVINREKCVFCGKCKEVCPTNAIVIIRLRCEIKEDAKIIEVDKYEFIEYLSERCASCLVCLKNCPFHAIEEYGDKIRIDINKCELCGKCEEICPLNAIILR
ncbi:4Fe-4S ferredoxin iron-sulfur binding domain protein [Methanocaldococcus vulcanius M7]|uniref:4Fe-4S ferredoxin iron-sulfur binding domain protein n=1 Tax=Methanocaldococcus vulcanius (strain ATCC 700851 / DSM 12094 / M7) TaxID=579137 RepID=C9RFJ7_METVM|nr:4Fe-4S binding protein [Methanocaldococcus vulcanius]ACX72349.1 4Fe-4S ferredoxin iron-sulfur binding domain protein [Methanocaldococcus vulcanius M7]